MATDDGQITLKIHGLDVDGDLVRADVFVEKLRALVDALKRVDRLEHGGRKPRHQYIISDLQIGSALATVREKPMNRRRMPTASSVSGLADVVAAIYDGDTRRAASFPVPLIQSIRRITDGSDKTFSHAEIAFPHGQVIRIDDFLAQRVREVEDVSNENEAVVAAPEFFHGTAYGTFEGELRELDDRGTLLRGKLILAGGVELDCVMNRDELPTIVEHFTHRVSVNAVAHYDGTQPLPVRLEIRSFDSLPDDPSDLSRWRGALRARPHDDAEEEW